MRLMGEQFVAGQTIDEALSNAALGGEGFSAILRHAGRSAVTAAQAYQYNAGHRRAIHATSSTPPRRGIYDGRGISISSRRCIRVTAAPSGSACRPSSNPAVEGIGVLANGPRYRAQRRCRGSRPPGNRLDCVERTLLEPRALQAGTASAFVVRLPAARLLHDRLA